MAPKRSLSGRFDVAVKDLFLEVIGGVHLRSAQDFSLRRTNRCTTCDGKAGEQQGNRDGVG